MPYATAFPFACSIISADLEVGILHTPMALFPSPVLEAISVDHSMMPLLKPVFEVIMARPWLVESGCLDAIRVPSWVSMIRPTATPLSLMLS